MSGLDVGIIVLAIVGAFLGMKVGAVSAFFNVVGGFLGGWAASRLYLPVMGLTGLSTASAYLITFVVVAGLLMAAGIAVSHLLESFFLGLVDKFLGALLGIAVSLVFMTAVFLPMILEQNPSLRGLFKRSAFAPYLVRSMQKYFEFAPENIWKTVEPSIESESVSRVRKLLESNIRAKRDAF